ncbi:MAG: TenA family protein [Gemmatimonadota bacterium]|nr:MAG: TenA family protein [Gemmatimonadota bacterium]
MSFCEEQLTRVRPIWERILDHRFLKETRDGTIAHETFATWMRQDYLFVEAAIPFIAALMPKAPLEHREALGQVLPVLEKELELFRERAEQAGVDLEGVEPSFVNHAYVQFLLASAYTKSYAGAFTVLYVAEKAYYDSWMVVRDGIEEGSTWYPFVENWTSDAFRGWVDFLQTNLDALAESSGATEREQMAELFELTAKYELAFWEMAATGQGWPCLEGEVT